MLYYRTIQRVRSFQAGGLLAAILSMPHVLLAQQSPTQPAPTPPTLQEVLDAGRDLWGEAAMAIPDGERYAFFAALLPPLRYVNAAFRHYPIVLSAPGSPGKARLVSNGSAINARADLKTWREVGVPVTFEIGQERKVFGDDPRALDGPHYVDGYLPIVQLSDRCANGHYEEEVFASTDPALTEHGAVFVRFTLRDGERGLIAARLGSNARWDVAGHAVRDEQGRTLVGFDSAWQWDAPRRSLVASLTPGTPAVLAIFTKPIDSLPPSALASDPDVYDRQRQMCVRTWQDLLRRGMHVAVPEETVNRAWRSLVVGLFMLAKGDLLCYSAGNQYDHQYEAECGDAVRALLLYGFVEDARRMVVPLLDHQQAGLGFHQAAFKLQLLAHYFWLTRDVDFVRQQQPRWSREVNTIVTSREAASGLLPPEHYCGDIGTNVYSLNSNANAWRGLRDMGAILRELGDTQEGERLATSAAQFRERIRQAVEQSVPRDIKPPFVPIALFGKEQPYDALYKSKMGGYWCLMAPYVLGSGVFESHAEQTGWILDYLHERGGVCMGMIRFDQHSGLFANEKGVDDLYGLRYMTTLLQRDEVDRALVGFYGKLAQGFTRDTFIGAEGTSLVPLDKGGRPMYLPPNASSNALFLWALRYLLVQDWDQDDDGQPDTLRLGFATPRHWLADGATLRIDRAPTSFGPVSMTLESRLARGEVLADVTPPPHTGHRTWLRVRLPAGWKVISADTGGTDLPIQNADTVDISERDGRFSIRFRVTRSG